MGPNGKEDVFARLSFAGIAENAIYSYFRLCGIGTGRMGSKLAPNRIWKISMFGGW